MSAPGGPDGGLGVSELLRERVAVVTGASRGIGAATARALGAHGATVAVNYLHNTRAAHRVAEQVRALGGRAQPFAADVTDPAAAHAMVEEVCERFGPVDLVVNNALSSYAFDPLGRRTAWDIPWEDYETQFRGSVGGAFNVCRAAIPGMRAHGSGRIVNMVTDLIERPSVPYHDYSTAKSALRGFSRNLAPSWDRSESPSTASRRGWFIPPTPAGQPPTSSGTSSNLAPRCAAWPPPTTLPGRYCSSPASGRGL